MGQFRLRFISAAALALMPLPWPSAAAAQVDIIVLGDSRKVEIERILDADNVDTARLPAREVADVMARIVRGRAPEDFWLAYRAHVTAWQRLAQAESGRRQISAGVDGEEAVIRAEQAVERSFDEVERLARRYGARVPAPASKRPAAAADSASADEGDDLEIVAVLDLHLGEGGAGDDFEVALHRHASRLEAEIEGQLGDADALRHAAVFAVDGDRKGVVVNHEPPYSVSPWRRYPPSMC
jgi:hypothetical protein